MLGCTTAGLGIAIDRGLEAAIQPVFGGVGDGLDVVSGVVGDVVTAWVNGC